MHWFGFEWFMRTENYLWFAPLMPYLFIIVIISNSKINSFLTPINIWERRSYMKSLEDSRTVFRCAHLYALRTALLRHTEITTLNQQDTCLNKLSKEELLTKCCLRWIAVFFLIVLLTEGNHPSFFSNGISLFLSFSKTPCKASICQIKRSKH